MLVVSQLRFRVLILCSILVAIIIVAFYRFFKFSIIFFNPVEGIKTRSAKIVQV